MLNNSETDRKKSAQYRVKSRPYKWLLLITENLKKDLTNFSSTHVRICAKDATPLLIMILNDHKVSYFSYFQKKGYFNSSQSEGFPKKEELKSSLGTMSYTFKKHYFHI